MRRRLEQKSLDIQRRHAAEAGRRDRLTIDLVGDVAGREHARNIGVGRARLRLDVAVGFSSS